MSEAQAMFEPQLFDTPRPPIEITGDDDLAALIAIAGLPSLTPKRFWSLLELGPPAHVWQRIIGGGRDAAPRTATTATRWAGWSSLVDPMTELTRHDLAGVSVLPFGGAGYPDALLDDPEPPPVIFQQGPAPLDDRVRVAIVGTRNCTPYGRDIATDLGGQLASRGVDVVSGLASGVDAAAHAGAIRRHPERCVAVIANGVDVIYPVTNRGLYRQIGAGGALLSEWPLGARPTKWRFPARNRLVAALSAAVVVVESGLRGGSMYTVDEALSRNRAVFAVPGSIRSPVSAGTNKLLADGAHSLHDIDELLDVIAPVGPPGTAATETPARSGPRPSAVQSWLFEWVGWEPIELDSVVAESGRSPIDVTLEVEQLIACGALRRTGGVVERLR